MPSSTHMVFLSGTYPQLCSFVIQSASCMLAGTLINDFAITVSFW
uniref:Uncharacterized protein n=1 Tax=Arundo donax TaxID=35708 RepID=A0A0A9EP86_ARUDO